VKNLPSRRILPNYEMRQKNQDEMRLLSRKGDDVIEENESFFFRFK